jgi:hypothetical protein
MRGVGGRGSEVGVSVLMRDTPFVILSLRRIPVSRHEDRDPSQAQDDKA